MPTNRPSIFGFVCLVPLFSCASHQPAQVRLTTPCYAAASTVAKTWRALDDARQRPGGCDAENGLHCEVLRQQIARLSIDCPNDAEVLMANAVLAFENRNFARSQQLLDELEGPQALYPEAVALRAQIAIQQGNTTYALRALERSILLNGDHSGLREVYASALYLTNRWSDATEQLAVARRLGAPVWRVSYGFGLIEEAQGHFEIAKVRYREALQDRPGWQQPESRLRALAATGKVQTID